MPKKTAQPKPQENPSVQRQAVQLLKSLLRLTGPDIHLSDLVLKECAKLVRKHKAPPYEYVLNNVLDDNKYNTHLFIYSLWFALASDCITLDKLRELRLCSPITPVDFKDNGGDIDGLLDEDCEAYNAGHGRYGVLCDVERSPFIVRLALAACADVQLQKVVQHAGMLSCKNSSLNLGALSSDEEDADDEGDCR